MKPVISILNLQELERLATRSNFRYGKEIAKKDGVKLTEHNVYNYTVAVTLGNKESCITTLSSTPKGLRWKCTCTSKKNYFCQHCVAAGLSLIGV